MPPLFFKIKIKPSMCEQEKERQRIYDFLNAETKSMFLCLSNTKQRFFSEKELFKESGNGGVNKKTKRRLSNYSPCGD